MELRVFEQRKPPDEPARSRELKLTPRSDLLRQGCAGPGDQFNHSPRFVGIQITVHDAEKGALELVDFI